MAEELLKVVIVDDEYLIRNLLKNCIKWQKIGIEIAGEAQSALEALELVDNVRPDIIFIDVNMPIMNGIELSKVITEKYPFVKIIILTGYQEFEYAKSGIKLGITDFLTKPIVASEILQSVMKVKEKIAMERNNKNELENLKKQLQESMPYVRERFLNELIQKGIDVDKSINKFKYFDIKLKGDFYQIAVIEIENYDGVPKSDEEIEQLLKLKYFNHIISYNHDNQSIQIFFDSRQRVVLLNTDKSSNFINYCEKIKSMLINSFKCFATFGVGNSHQEIKNIYLSYNQANEALKYKIFAGKNQVISYDEVNVIQDTNDHNLDIDLDDLHFFIKAGMQDKAENFIDAQFDYLKLKPGLNIDSLRVIAINTLSAILNILHEMEINQAEIFGEVKNPYEKVFNIDMTYTIKQYFKDIINKSILIINSRRNEKEIDIIESVQKYLNENMNDFELSLQRLGNIFYINESYLSRLFKQKSGVNFVEYLTNIRIQKCIEFLKDENMKVYQIAEQVGIIDPHYLGVCFKKVTGISISDYRRKLE